MGKGIEPILNNVRQGLEKAFPPVMAQLLRELVKPHPDFSDIAKVISLDPVMSAAVLTLVNSPFYALSQKIKDLERAAVVLGTKEILKIALSFSFLKGRLKTNKEDGFHDWRLIVWAAIAAELISERLCPEQTHQAYLCALLKDLSLLLVQTTQPDALIPEHEHGVLTCLHPEQLRCESEAWGMNHAELTIRVLEEWDIPDLGCGCIGVHHDMDHLERYDPLAQSVILATQWSELVNDCDRDPILLVQFEMIAREHLNISQEDIEELKAICIQRYRSMLSIIGLEEASPDRRMYEHSVQTMQTYHFLAMEITGATGGERAVGRIIGRHLRWNFGLTDWDLSLRSPQDDSWRLLQSTKEGGLETSHTAEMDIDLPWKFAKQRFLMLSSGEKWGELRVRAGLTQDAVQELTLYTRFLSRAYEQYCMRQAVLESKARTLDTLPVGVGRLDAKGNIQELNRTLYEFLGQPEDPKDMDIANCLPPLGYTGVGTEWGMFLGNAEKQSFSKVFCVPGDGSFETLRCLYFSAHREIGAGREGILFMAEDITEVSELEIQALKQGEFMEQLVESMQDLVMTVDHTGLVTFSSPRYADRITGRNLFAIAKPVGSFAGVWNPKLLDADPPPVEVLLQLRDGSFLSLELMISRLRGSGDAAPSFMVVGRDLTSVRRLEEKLKRQAVYDSLTDLYNRHQFHATLSREVQRSNRTGRTMGLLFFDLDGFKIVNDTQGHQAGDQVLKGVGAILRETVRKGTDFPCRFGGDEFAVVATDAPYEGLVSLAGRIRDAVIKQYGSLVGISMGVAVLSEGEAPESLLKRADHACYKAKAKGGNSIVQASKPSN